MITASLSTVAWRRPALERMLPTILPQVDRLYVFLQGYDVAPDCVTRDPKIHIAEGRYHPEWLALKSTAKLFWIAQGLVPEGIYLTVDDDILYPPTYASHCAAKIEQYGRKAIVGFHGSIFEPTVDNLFRDREAWNFVEACPADVGVHAIGTGTAAWHTSTLRLTPEDLSDWDAVDFRLAIAAQRQGVPMVCLARDAGYLRSLPLGADKRSCSELADYKERMAGFYREHSPWVIHRAESAIPPRPVVVVVPCYREKPDRVMRSVDSALATPGVDLVRVIDDGAPEPLVLPPRDRLEVIRRVENGGPAAALDSGIRTLPADAIVCRLDVGDEFYPEAKGRQIAEVKSGKVRASASPRFDPVRRIECYPAANWEQRIYTDCQFSSVTTVYERSAWLDAGGNATQYRWCEDWLFAMRMQAAVGWHLFPEVTCSAGAFPGGHSDVGGDPARWTERSKCRAAVAEVGRALGNPDKFKHLFDPRWCKKRGVEPLAIPRKK